MSPRSPVTTKYLWYLLVLIWSPVRSVQVAVGGARPPHKAPPTIEAQAKFFQDFFSVQLSPYNIEFGHVCEDPNSWEQRYEKKDFKNHRDMGKVRWGDKKGGYGEHYWDLNHAGHANDHGDGDDGHYNHQSDDEPYHHDNDNSNYGSNDHSPIYGNDDYDPEKSSYEENGRAKRAHPKIKSDKRYHTEDNNDYDEPITPKLKKRKNKEQSTEPPPRKVEKYSEEDDDEESDEEVYKKPKRQHYQQSEEEEEEEPKQKEAKNQVVLVVKEKDRSKHQQIEQEQKRAEALQTAYPNNQAYTQYVPYEGGAGVRQHHQPEIAAAASVPRLFLEPSTGHIVDSATGQAYVLQPIAVNNNYN